MGKSFQKEIGNLPDTIRKSLSEPIGSELERTIATLLPFPLLIVGSGGSLSGANYIARLHESATGLISRALTPLDFCSSNIDPSCHAILFLTASGGNRDILRAFDFAVQREFVAISIICARIGSKISQKAVLYPHVNLFEFANPSGKDGFLAVNSLVSTCILAARAYGYISHREKEILMASNRSIPEFDTPEWQMVLDSKTIVAVGGMWAWPALVDLESKFAEAALKNVLISDLRNFGHGRHHWFDKRGDESALLVFSTATSANLAKKTISLLPPLYPRAVLNSLYEGPIAGIDLLLQVFHLVDEIGRRVGIDPGKPKVPEFGRQIYHLGLNPPGYERRISNRKIWTDRKSRVTGAPVSLVDECLERFIIKLKNSDFAAIVLDYDGTICDPPERFTAPRPEMGIKLNHLLSKGILIGIATGRGSSVQKSLREIIDAKYWDRVLVGNHNGATILPLTDGPPEFNRDNQSTVIYQALGLLADAPELLKDVVSLKAREKQISVRPIPPASTNLLLEIVLERLQTLKGIKILQSDHSIDVLDASVSKIQVVELVRTYLHHGTCDVLIVGDQGHLRGNDSEMLRDPCSLSVDKISSSLNTCWNLSPVGQRGARATLSLMNAIHADEGFFKIDIDILKRYH